jgi:hypothetical protein
MISKDKKYKLFSHPAIIAVTKTLAAKPPQAQWRTLPFWGLPK